MPKKQLPRFVIYQANAKEFHFCLEVAGAYLRWCSYYTPSMDVRFAREVTRIGNLQAKKLPKKTVFDEGTYQVARTDTKETAEQKLLDGINQKTFAFILVGKKLKGRFAFKKVRGGTVLQKYKDKYATEEDILFGDLRRTVDNMIPDYDERKVKLPPKNKPKKTTATPAQASINEVPTADKQIGKNEYHFTFYQSDEGPEICLITDEAGDITVLKREKNGWTLLAPLSRIALKNEKAFIDHAAVLYQMKD